MNETPAELASADAAAASFPWPPHPDQSTLEAFAATWKQCCFQPTAFYRALPREGAYGAVLAYYLVIGVVVTGIQLFWSNVLGVWGLRTLLTREESTAYGDLVEFLLAPLLLLIALYLVTAVTHFLLVVLQGARENFQTSSRVLAFSYSPGLFAVVPFIGDVVAFVWMVCLAIIGLREAHRTSGARAALAVLLPVFLLFALMLLAVVAGLLLGVLETPI